MAQSVLEQMKKQIHQTARKGSRAGSAAADALQDGIGAARRAAKHGSYIAGEFLDDTKKRIQRHPIEAVVATFTAGAVIAGTISWMMSRRQRS
jgi:nitrate/TMAO reductase-like tetraheme cytochrome c subunit